MANANPVSIPMDPNIKLAPNLDDNEPNYSANLSSQHYSPIKWIPSKYKNSWDNLWKIPRCD
jgi:hypothetical protein